MIDHFFMGNLASIPMFEVSTNHGKGYRGLHFWALLRRVHACMDLGITCIEECGTHTAITYIHLLFCIGMPEDKLKDMMHNSQPTQFPVWSPNGMWTMAKNYRTKFHNSMLPYYNKLGSGHMWRDAEENTVKAYFFEYATECNTAEEKKGKQGRLDIHIHAQKQLFAHVLLVHVRPQTCSGGN
jgi:hypothetical protein